MNRYVALKVREEHKVYERKYVATLFWKDEIQTKLHRQRVAQKGT